MKIISCENFSLQAATLSATATTDTIVKCGNTGKRYYWTGTAWSEYFDFSQGGNITITPLNQVLPKASVSSRNIIDTPYSAEVINNFNLITGEYSMPTSGTYARAFIAPHTGRYSNVKFLVGSTPVGGGIHFGIYNDSGNLLAQSFGVADSTMSNGWTNADLNRDASGNMITFTGGGTGVILTGGQLYYIGVRNTMTTSKIYGFNNLPNLSIATNRHPVQGFSATYPSTGVGVPNTITLNGSNQAIFPYISLEIRN